MFYPRDYSSGLLICALTCLFHTIVATGAAGQGVATAEGRACAKGVVLLRATIPSGLCPRYTTLKVGPERMDKAGEPGTMTIRGTYIQSSAMNNEGCALLVPAFAGPNEYHQIGIAFPTAGLYRVRWEFGATGTSPVDFAIDHSVRIEAATPSDLSFLARVSDPKVLRGLFGQDFFERQGEETKRMLLGTEGADARAMKVFGEILKITCESALGAASRTPKTLEELEVWAESLWTLAREIPDSSYAPYAAYYAASCHAARVSHRLWEMSQADRRAGKPFEETRNRPRPDIVAVDPDAARAREALAFVVDRADAYLLPKALCGQAECLLAIGRGPEAGGLVARAEELANGDPLMTRRVRDLRESLRRLDQEKP